jgi:hypothetical protein
MTSKSKTIGFFIFLFLTSTYAICQKKEISFETYQQKVYDSWIGQIVGNVIGMNYECVYNEEPFTGEFKFEYAGWPLDMTLKHRGAYVNDDTFVEYMYLLTMQKYGAEPTYQQLAEGWIERMRIAIWLANRSARGNSMNGIHPPVSGSKNHNPFWSEIDAQLINEIFAVTAPGMIQYAIEKTDWASQIMVDDWGKEPAIFYGAMYAAAFFESDYMKLLTIGENALAPGSRFRNTINEIKKIYAEFPDPDDWQKARAKMAEKYYFNEPALTRSIFNANLNGACAVLAMLYGKGNIAETLKYTCILGFDADNQAATVTGLYALAQGLDGIPRNLVYPIKGAKMPFNDRYVNISRDWGQAEDTLLLNDISLTEMAEGMASLGREVVLKNGGKIIRKNNKEYLQININASFTPPLELPSYQLPYLLKGDSINHNIVITTKNKPIRWKISGTIPKGLVFRDGKLMGKPVESGIFNFTLEAKHKKERAVCTYQLIVNEKNLAFTANEVITNVEQDSSIYAKVQLQMSKDYHAYDINSIRDGIHRGEKSTYLSLCTDSTKKVHFFGYIWNDIQQIGTLQFMSGGLEHMGGWFNDLYVEHLDEEGNWIRVDNLTISPSISGKNTQLDKGHFITYLLTFEAVLTKGIRLIGNAGGTGFSKKYNFYFSPFVSIAELCVDQPLDNR